MDIQTLQQNIPEIIAAIAGLGMSSFALVDTSKAFWGGVSNAGFGFVRQAVTRLFDGTTNEFDDKHPLGLNSMLAILRANWLNGTALTDQKAIAKSLVKLRLNSENARQLAMATGVDPGVLSGIANKIAHGDSLDQKESDAFGRFDLMLTAILDEGYQRADQMYRNNAKAWSVFVSVLLALAGGWIIPVTAQTAYQPNDFAISLLIGLLATPLAPISKDLSTALVAGVRAIQSVRR